MAEDDVTKVVDNRERFPAAGTYVQESVTLVPASDRYPDGVKYSFQYGRDDDDADDNTIIRYDNFPDHPDAPRHHKHTESGEIEPVEFEGYRALRDRFKAEVNEHGTHWP